MFKTFGAYISEKFVGKIAAENMDAAWTMAVARWGAEGLKVNLWYRGA